MNRYAKQIYYYCQNMISKMNTTKSKQKMNKSLSSSNLYIQNSRNLAKSSLRSTDPSPNNTKTRNNIQNITSTSRQKSLIKNKSTFKLYIGKQKQQKSVNKTENSRISVGKENINQNKQFETQIQAKPKGRKLKEVRLAISNPDSFKQNKKIQKQEKLNIEQMDKNILKDKSSDISKYVQKDQLRKVSLEDFVIIRQTQQEKHSNEYLVVHKKLKCLFTLKKFNKNMVLEQQILEKLVQSVKIHFYLSLLSKMSTLQQIYMIFHDISSVYVILEPVFSCQAKQKSLSSEQCIISFNKILLFLKEVHSMGIILRNLDLNSIKSQMGVLKITNMIHAANFSFQKRRQSFLGSLSKAPHEVIIGQCYDGSYDMWCLGLILYELILKFPPFQGLGLADIRNLNFKLPISQSFAVSQIISSLLCQKENRLTAQQCLELPLFADSKQTDLINRDIYSFWAKQEIK